MSSIFHKNLKIGHVLLFLLAILNLLVAYFYIQNMSIDKTCCDTPGYLSAMKYLQGVKITEEIPFHRLLTTPLMLYASIFASYFTGSLVGGMLVVNIIFYFLSIYIFYKLVLEIYNEHRVAVLSSMLFLGNYCLYNFGTTFMADMGGWFFFILGSYFAVKYFYHNDDRKFYFLAILAASTGILFKEYGALGLVSLSFVILCSESSWQRKIRELLAAAFLFLIIPLIYHVGFYLKFHFSYFDWYFYALNSFVLDSHDVASEYGLILLIKVLGWVFFAGWPIFAFGAWQATRSLDRKRKLLLAALLPASLAFLAWPALTQRIAFIFVPWLVLIAGFGLSKIRNDYLAGAIIAAYFVLNYITPTILINIINVPF